MRDGVHLNERMVVDEVASSWDMLLPSCICLILE